MRRFTIEQPTTLTDASALLRAREDARVIAGGTALVLLMKEGLLRPATLVALRRIPGLTNVEISNGMLHLGAMVTQHDVEISPIIRRAVPLLPEAAGKVGNIRVRCASTVGGSLAEADYQSDLAPALAAADARVEIYGPDGTRLVPVAEFLRGMYEVDLRPGEVVAGVRVPLPPAGTGMAYLKHVTGPITDRPCIGVAAVVTLDSGGICRGLRVALSSVLGFNSRPLVVDAAVIGGEGRRLDDAAIDVVAEAVYREADPPDDLRGSSWYRKEMTRVFTRRALAAARVRAARA